MIKLGCKHCCFLVVVKRKPEVRVTVRFGFMQLVKDLTISGQNSPEDPFPSSHFPYPKLCTEQGPQGLM